MNVEKLKTTISEKIRLLSLRNQDWKTVKAETKQINKFLIHVSTKNLLELNELIHAEAKLVCEKSVFPRRKKHE